jgi:hypothetical protein
VARRCEWLPRPCLAVDGGGLCVQVGCGIMSVRAGGGQVIAWAISAACTPVVATMQSHGMLRSVCACHAVLCVIPPLKSPHEVTVVRAGRHHPLCSAGI